MKWYILAGILGLLAIPLAQAQFWSDKTPIIENQTKPTVAKLTSLSSIDKLVKSAPVILIAELIGTPSEKLKSNAQPINSKLNLEKELKKVTEHEKSGGERVYFDLQADNFKTRRFKTIQPLKGPNTDILSLPTTDLDVETAKSGDLFVIMLGVQDPDAILPIKSLSDPLVQHIQSIIE